MRDTDSPSRGSKRPSRARKMSLKRSEGAGNAGCPMHPQPRARWGSQVCARVFTAEAPENIRHSPRNGFTTYCVLSLGTGLSCPHRPRDDPATLASASGGQDHTLSRPHRRRSSARMNRARRQSVHRIPRPTCRDDRPIRPSFERGGTARIMLLIWGRSQVHFRKSE